MKTSLLARATAATVALLAIHSVAATPAGEPAGSTARSPVLPDLTDTYVPTAPANDELYRDLGGQAGVQKLADDFMLRLMADKRMEPFFRDTDQKEFKSLLATQFCEVAGGPCKSVKRNMKKIHSAMDINKSNFNALVEVLQQSMDAQGIAFSTQNKLLAQLAPMHRDIINVK